MAEEAPSSDEKLFCTVHPTVETSLRCNKCGRPMCVKCAQRTPVGYRCKECVKGQLQVFYTAQPLDLVIQGVVSFLMSMVAAALVSLIGGGMFWLLWIVGLAVASGAGTLIADTAFRASGKRRGQYSWLIVGGAMVLGAIAVALLPTLLLATQMAAYYANPEIIGEGGLAGWGMVGMLGLTGFTNIGWWIYVVVATGAAISRLRLGR